LITTGATSATGFLFHRDHLLPSHIVGVLALVVLAVTCLALYRFHLRGIWRIVYAAGAVISLWFNVFVLIAQAFLKIAPLHELAPSGSEPPFAISQGLVFILFIALGILASKRFQPAAA
jgi:Ca2+/Na+ antiporter